MNQTIPKTARERLISVIPHIRYQVSQAKKQGEAAIGVLYLGSNGEGEVKAHFDAESFIDDIAEILGMGPQTAADNERAKMIELAASSGLRS